MLNRRQFLKGAVLATAAAGAASVAGIAASNGAGGLGQLPGRGHDLVSVRGRMYRLDGTARVLVSRDAGSSWAVHSKFAPRFAAERLKVDTLGDAWLVVRHDDRRFRLLLSEDGLAWRTTA